MEMTWKPLSRVYGVRFRVLTVEKQTEYQIEHEIETDFQGLRVRALMIENQAKVSFVRKITCFVTLPLGLLLKSLK